MAHIPVFSSTRDPEHEAMRQRLLDFLQKEAGDRSALECLAVAAYAVGQLVAMQDGSTITAETAMTCVHLNLRQGNRDVIESLTYATPAGRA